MATSFDQVIITDLYALDVDINFSKFKEGIDEKYKTKFTTRVPIKEDVFFSELKPEHFSPVTVGTSKGDELKPDIRSGKVYDGNGSYKSDDMRSKLNHISIQRYTHWGDDSYDSLISGVQIKKGVFPFVNKYLTPYVDYRDKFLKYEVGDHFDTFHYDTFKNSNERGTLLIFPPNKYNVFTGGHLVFKNDAGEEKIVDPSQFTKWTAVAFGKVLHKCTPITSGTRYVLKYTIKANIPGIPNDDKYLKKEHIDELIAKYNNTELKVKIEQNILVLKQEIKELIIERQKLEKDFYDDMLETILSGETTYDNNNDDKYEESKNSNSYYLTKNFTETLTHKTYEKHDIETINTQIDTKMLEYQFLTYKLNFIDIDELQVTSEEIITSLKESIHPVVYFTGTYYKDINEYKMSHLKLISELIDTGLRVFPMNMDVSYKKKFDDRFGDSEDYHHKLEKYTWIKEGDFNTGMIDSKYSEYNDEGGYDKHTRYNITCFLIYN